MRRNTRRPARLTEAPPPSGLAALKARRRKPGERQEVLLGGLRVEEWMAGGADSELVDGVTVEVDATVVFGAVSGIEVGPEIFAPSPSKGGGEDNPASAGDAA
jgi:hypothetical protein